jgi:hypothetical protein
MGFPDVAFNPTDLVVHELTIQGSFIGNRVQMREMLGIRPTSPHSSGNRNNAHVKG